MNGFKPQMSSNQDEFWAVKDVSFELKRVECPGLMAANFSRLDVLTYT